MYPSTNLLCITPYKDTKEIKICDPFKVALYNYYHIWQLESASNWVWLAAALGYDFGWYWTHRLSHEMNFAWAGHFLKIILIYLNRPIVRNCKSNKP